MKLQQKMKNILAKAANSLGRFTDRHPYGSKIVLSFSLTSFADYLNQTKIQKRDWDVSRTARLGFISALMVSTNSVLYFQHFIPRVWNTRYFKSMKSENQKILLTLQLDFVILFPVSTTIWLSLVEFLKERNFENSQQFVMDNWTTNYKRMFCFWSLANFINYKYVPLKYRVYYAISANFVWALAIILLNDYKIGAGLDKDKEMLCVEEQ